MAKRGRKLAPEHLRFEGAGVIPAVYVMEVGDAIKVGHSRRPAKRFRELHREHEKRGEAIGRYMVFALDDILNCMTGERAAIHALTKAAQVIPGHIEYFHGITFEEAKSLVARAIPVFPNRRFFSAISPQASQSAITPICSPSPAS